MKTNTVTKTVEVTISNATLLNLFVNAIYADAKVATGKDRTFYKAFGSLVGIRDVEAVKRANADELDKRNHITTKEFRRWLPTVFAEFARVMLEGNDGVLPAGVVARPDDTWESLGRGFVDFPEPSQTYGADD